MSLSVGSVFHWRTLDSCRSNAWCPPSFPAIRYFLSLSEVLLQCLDDCCVVVLTGLSGRFQDYHSLPIVEDPIVRWNVLCSDQPDITVVNSRFNASSTAGACRICTILGSPTLAYIRESADSISSAKSSWIAHWKTCSVDISWTRGRDKGPLDNMSATSLVYTSLSGCTVVVRWSSVEDASVHPAAAFGRLFPKAYGRSGLWHLNFRRCTGQIIGKRILLPNTPVRLVPNIRNAKHLNYTIKHSMQSNCYNFSYFPRTVNNLNSLPDAIVRIPEPQQSGHALIHD